MKKICLIFLILLLVFTVGCSPSQGDASGNIEMMVSKDFGKESISNISIDFSDGQTVLDIMDENYDIETAYGGGFVNGIGGLKSGFTNQAKREKIDWFYYINGILTQVGADSYDVRAKDTVVWDYHYWDNADYLSSIIGAYPSNYINGYNGKALNLNILTLNGYEEEVEKLQQYLMGQGVANIEISEVSQEALVNEDVNTIVIGLWDELLEFDYINQLYEDKERAGLLFDIDGDIKALDHNNTVIKSYDKGAVIASVLKGYGDMSTTWLITGNDESCIEKSVRMLHENPEEIKGFFSAMVTEDALIHLPMNE